MSMKLKADITLSQIGDMMGKVDKGIGSLQRESRLDDAAKAFANTATAKPVRTPKLAL